MSLDLNTVFLLIKAGRFGQGRTVGQVAAGEKQEESFLSCKLCPST